jgi:hypothetical protein
MVYPYNGTLNNTEQKDLFKPIQEDVQDKTFFLNQP